MRCEDIMKRDVECVGTQDTVQDAARRMREANVGFLPVCDSGNKVLGTVTDRDLAIRVLAEGKASTAPVGEVMSREVIACRPGDDLSRAEDLLAAHKKSRIICTDESGRLAGVISLSDVAQYDQERIGVTMREVTEREAPSLH
jgi:CBS domain-containing protein